MIAFGGGHGDLHKGSPSNQNQIVCYQIISIYSGTMGIDNQGFRGSVYLSARIGSETSLPILTFLDPEVEI